MFEMEIKDFSDNELRRVFNDCVAQKCLFEQWQAAQKSFAPDAANAPRIVEVLDENGNPQKIAVI